MEKCFQLMSDVKSESDLIFERNNLQEKEFIRCNTFGNLLKPHSIFLLGINPGGNEEDAKYDKNELEFYKKNPDYNELLLEESTLIKGLRKLYKSAFGEEQLEDMLSKTYYWNLCLSKSSKAYNKNKSEFIPVFNLYWDLFLKTVNIVRPEIILTFVSIKEFLESKINRAFSFSKLVESGTNYYYTLDNVKLSDFNVRKIIAVNHLSWSHKFTDDEWVEIGKRLREDFDNQLNL